MVSPSHHNKSGSRSGRPNTTSTSQSGDSIPYSYTRTILSPEEERQHIGVPMPDRMNFDGTWEHQTLPTLAHSRSGSHLQTMSSPEHRLSVGPSLMMSSMSSMPSLKQNSRRPSGFKATIKRMFGSKRQKVLVHEARKEYHLSDPGSLTFNTNPYNHHNSAPTTSRPRTAMQKSALGSHTINSADVRDFEVPRIQISPAALKRRNTLPSLAFSDNEALSFSRRLGDLMSDTVSRDVSNHTSAQTFDKKRSRSTEALTASLSHHNTNTSARPDRDSEIAFWRNSILLNPLSKTRDAEEASNRFSDDNVKEMPSLEQIIQPQQSFDFGLDDRGTEPADLEDRVNTLEVKMFDFEYAIARLQGVELPKPTLPKKRMKRRNVQEVFAKPSIQSLATSTSSHDQRPITPADVPIMPTSLKDLDIADRTSKATIRPQIPGDSPLGTSIRTSLRLTMDQYNTLMSMIQDEKDARQLMEMQILDLQREIELLQTPVYATINYPLPSPDSGKNTSQKKLHRSPPFRFNKSSVRETSRFSMAESDADSATDSHNETFETPKEHQNPFNPVRSSSLVGVVS